MKGLHFYMALAIVLFFGACKKPESDKYTPTTERQVWEWQMREFIHPNENNATVLGMYHVGNLLFVYYTETVNGAVYHKMRSFDGKTWTPVFSEIEDGGRKYFTADRSGTLAMIDFETDGTQLISALYAQGTRLIKAKQYNSQDYHFKINNKDQFWYLVTYQKEAAGVTNVTIEKQLSVNSMNWVVKDSMVGSSANPLGADLQVVPYGNNTLLIFSDIANPTQHKIYEYNTTFDSIRFLINYTSTSSNARFFYGVSELLVAEGTSTDLDNFHTVSSLAIYGPNWFDKVVKIDHSATGKVIFEIYPSWEGAIYTLGEVSVSQDGNGAVKKLTSINYYRWPGGSPNNFKQYSINLDEASYKATQKLGADFLGEGDVYQGAFYAFFGNDLSLYAIGNAYLPNAPNDSKIYLVKYVE